MNERVTWEHVLTFKFAEVSPYVSPDINKSGKICQFFVTDK